jgi:hypothetical protein
MLFSGALLSIIDKVFDRPPWIDWIPPALLVIIIGGIVLAISELVISRWQKKYNIIFFVFRSAPASLLLLFGWSFSCNHPSLVDGILIFLATFYWGILAISFYILFHLRKPRPSHDYFIRDDKNGDI